MIKSQILKNIIYGLIFSIIFGIISNLLYSKLKLEESVTWYKHLYVLDIDTTKSDKMSGIRNAGIVNYTKFISDQFFSSLKFSLFIFKKTNKLKVCEHIRIEEADLSIFIESKGYFENETEIIDSCFSEIISKAFNRFKEKLIIVVKDAILSKQITLNELKLEIDKLEFEALEREKKILNSLRLEELAREKREKEEIEREKKKQEYNATINQSHWSRVCQDVDKLLKNVIIDVNLYLDGTARNNNNTVEPSMISQFLSLDYLSRLSKECERFFNKPEETKVYVDNLGKGSYGKNIEMLKSALEDNALKNDTVFNFRIEKLNNQIKDIREFIKFSSIDELFNIEKRAIKGKERRREKYLTRTQTAYTFSILGFIVGFILSANYLPTLKRKK